MSEIRFVIHDREETPVGEIVRFSVYEGEPDDLCFCGTLCMGAAKYDSLKYTLALQAMRFPEIMQFSILEVAPV